MLAGIELVSDKATKRKPEPDLQVAARLSKAGYEAGILFRAFGDDIIGLAPPLCCTIEEIDVLCDRLHRIIDGLLPLIG